MRKNIEQLSKLRTPGAMVLAALSFVALSGCADTQYPEGFTPVESSELTGENGRVVAEATYFDNGTRQLTVSAWKSNIESAQARLEVISTVNQFCDGNDLVEVSTTSSVSRSVEHKACEDGMLTPDDF